MKENTKFLWMYVGILFSFALILIVFAGVSRNTDSEERKGLQADVASLSEKNTALKSENTKLFAQIDDLIAASDAHGERIYNFQSIETVLSQAYELYTAKRVKDARAYIADLDVNSLTTSQKIVYDTIKYGR